MRIDADSLPDPEIIFLSPSLRRARQVEAVLTERGVTYAVQAESLGRTTLFGSERIGAAFYVSSGQAAYCRQLLIEVGFAKGIVEDPGEDDEAPER